MITMEALTGFSFVMMRMTGCILFNPILGRRNFPAIFRVGMILVLSIVVFTFKGASVDIPQGTSIIPLILALISELLIGFAAGFVVNLFTYVVVVGGAFLDYQMGLYMANIYDPQSNVSLSLSSTYYNILFLFLFFGVNGHLALLRLFMSLENLIPYGQMSLTPELSTAVLDVFVRCTVLGVTMAMPMVTVQILLEIAVGILMKAIPQINIFVLNLQAKLMVGLLVILIVLSPISEFLRNVIVEMIDTVEQLFTLM